MLLIDDRLCGHSFCNCISLGLLYIFFVNAYPIFDFFSQYWPRDWLGKVSAK